MNNNNFLMCSVFGKKVNRFKNKNGGMWKGY